MPSDEYKCWVRRIWRRLEQSTGGSVFYLDARHVAARCPVCQDGTIRVAFIDQPQPGFAINSTAGGAGKCSHGCDELQILQALR